MTCACVRVCEHELLIRGSNLKRRQVIKKVSQTGRLGEILDSLQTKHRKHINLWQVKYSQTDV